MSNITMYCTRICPYCIRAEQLLRRKGVREIHKIMVDQNAHLLEEMIQRTHRRTVPQIFIGDRHVGGYDDLVDLDLAEELVPLLTTAAGSA